MCVTFTLSVSVAVHIQVAGGTGSTAYPHIVTVCRRTVELVALSVWLRLHDREPTRFAVESYRVTCRWADNVSLAEVVR